MARGAGKDGKGPVTDRSARRPSGPGSVRAAAAGAVQGRLGLGAPLLLGLVYGTGFVVVATHLSNYAAVPGEAFRLKYLAAGVLFFLPSLSPNLIALVGEPVLMLDRTTDRVQLLRGTTPFELSTTYIEGIEVLGVRGLPRRQPFADYSAGPSER